MNPQHQTFLLEYFRTGDKKQAYRKAYPQTKENCITNSVNRLLARADIAEAIHEQEQAKRKDIEAEIAERYKAEIIDHYEAQAYLSQIIRGELKREKWVKKKDHWETIEVTPTISETLRALNTFFRNNRNDAVKGMNTTKTGQIKEAPLLSLGGVSAGRGGNTQQEQEIPLPPEPTDTQPHPFGNIYPANYPGPYYDPDDPNTKDKLQNLRFDRLTDSPVTTTENNKQQQQQKQESSPPWQGGVPAGRGGNTQHGHTNTTTNNNQGRHSKIPKAFGKESPEPKQAAEQEKCSTATPQEISLPNAFGNRNDAQLSTTTENNKPQQNTVPPSGGGGGIPPYGSDGHYAAKQRAWRIKLEQLRKEGWETANELFNEVHDVFINNQHSGTYKMLKQFEKAVQSRNLPAEEREKIIQETGWEYHPEHPHVMRRRKKLSS